jgi:hypothetical protein
VASTKCARVHRLDPPGEFEYQPRVASHPKQKSWSRAHAAVTVASLALLVASVRTVAAEEKPAARAVLAAREQKIGVVAPGEPAVATFRIENAGSAPLTVAAGNPVPFIAGVESTVEGSPAAPGAAATVTIRIATGKRAGEGTIVVPVKTNDPDAEKIELRASVEVKPLLLADPGYARFNVVQQEREGTIPQTVWSTDGAAFRVLAVEPPTPALRTSFREAAAAERRADTSGSQWRIELTLPTDAPVGALVGDVVVVTDHPRQQRLYLPLSGFVRPVMAVTPPEAELGDVDGARAFRFTLDVKIFATESIALERATCDLPGATVEIVPVTAGRTYRVRVSVPEGLPSGPIAGTVRLFTASAKVAHLDVPVRGRIVAKPTPSADGK